MVKKFLQSHPVHKKIVPSLDLIFIIQPTLFFTIWILTISGMICANINTLEHSLWVTDFSLKIFFVFLGLTLMIGSVFILIQISLAEQDKSNFSFINNNISIEKCNQIARLLLIFGGLISFFSNWLSAILLMCIYYIWGIGINNKPIAWKHKFINSWIAHSFNGMLFFIIGWKLVVINEIIYTTDILLSILSYVVYFSAISYMIILIYSKMNLSESVSRLFVPLLMVCISLYLSLKIRDPFLSTTILVSLPFFLLAFFRRLNKDIIRSVRYPIFILNFFALSYYPWLSIPLICTYYLSKYYYWHRFDVHYPTFLVDND